MSTKKQKKYHIEISKCLLKGAALFLVFIFSASITQAATPAAFQYKLLEAFPGFYAAGAIVSDLPSYILSIYKFGIWTVGIAGLLMLTIGGTMYMGSAGNNATASKAKGIITDAIWGIVAALCAYLILFVINPDLTKIDIKFTAAGIRELQAPAATSGIPNTNNGFCDGTSAGCCKQGTSCSACSSCVPYANSYSNLCYKGAPGNSGCELNSVLASKLNSINLSSVNAEVSEAWPPTVTHSALCHTNGTCADVRCINGCANVSVATVQNIYQTMKSAGLNVLFESNNCSPYSAVGINCSSPPTMTAPSFHVSL